MNGLVSFEISSELSFNGDCRIVNTYYRDMEETFIGTEDYSKYVCPTV